MNIKTFRKGELIFRQGDYAETMFEIREGHVGIFTDYDTDARQQIAILGEEDVFGEMGLIECYPRSASAVAMDDTVEVVEINAAELSDAFLNKPGKVFDIMLQMIHRLRETNQNYLDACRTAYDTVRCEKSGTAKSSGLLERLNFFRGVYQKFSGR